jgi:hypothetical protein
MHMGASHSVYLNNARFADVFFRFVRVPSGTGYRTYLLNTVLVPLDSHTHSCTVPVTHSNLYCPRSCPLPLLFAKA